MFSFTQQQHTVTIGDVTLGGQPGHYPTVLIGGLFFKGEPNIAQATEHVKQMMHLSTQLGNPGILDVFIRKEELIAPILDFIENVLPKTSPFSVDITDPEVKIKVLQALHDRHLLKRTIYNSIHIGITPEEYAALKQHTPNATILVAFNPKDKSPDGKIEVLENGAHLTEKGLFQIAKDLNIDNVLVDTAALAPGDNSGGAVAALPVIKEEYGLPTGCAIHNVVEKSTWLTQLKDTQPVVDAASNLNIPLFGGDFAIFGPVVRAPLVFPIIAWQDILVSEYTESYFGVEPIDTHPRRILHK